MSTLSLVLSDRSSTPTVRSLKRTCELCLAKPCDKNVAMLVQQATMEAADVSLQLSSLFVWLSFMVSSLSSSLSPPSLSLPKTSQPSSASSPIVVVKEFVAYFPLLSCSILQYKVVTVVDVATDCFGVALFQNPTFCACGASP